ncbi:MAG TPA: pyridoxal-phosphate dependent enzyme [Nitrososphaerales archaeon]|nr:pyridoxal-phosphate dependent enzyme [Nitrososphaerales archaeon]
MPPEDPPVTLGEGGTPLLPSPRLGKELGVPNLLIKDESRNPTGSFIDRGSTVIVSLARSRGISEIDCVTTGNLGASLAAYCAKAGIDSRISVTPSTDREKLYQMVAYGAEVEAYREIPRGEKRKALLVTAGNPYLLSGEKTTCLEVVQDLGWTQPDAIVLPVGTGGHLSMTWMAMEELRSAGLVQKNRCRLYGAELSTRGAGGGFGSSRDHPPGFTELEDSEPFFAKEVESAYVGSRGGAISASPQEAVRATSLLARTEGIFAEPASAAAVAAISKAVSRGDFRRDDVIVCIVTGSGLKDTRAISRLAKATRRVSVRGDLSVARAQIGRTKVDILRALASKPGYGYAVWLGLSQSRSISTASVYQHLLELEEFGLVRKSGTIVSGGRERVLYELTARAADVLRIANDMQGMTSGGPRRTSTKHHGLKA